MRSVNQKIISTCTTSHLEHQISQKTMTPKNFMRAKITRRDFVAREVPKFTEKTIQNSSLLGSRHFKRVSASTRLPVLSCVAFRSRLCRDLWGFTRIYVRPGDMTYPFGPLVARAHWYQHEEPSEPTFLPVRPAIHHRKKCFSPPRVAAPLV